jgi:RNA polymerase sigma-70 factor, ECF subfamily
MTRPVIETYITQWNMVYETALRVLKNEQDAQDCAQDVYFVIVRRAKRMRLDSDRASRWVCVVTKRYALDVWRKHKAHAERSLDEPIADDEGNEIALSDSIADPRAAREFDRVEQRVLIAEIVEDGFSKLPPMQRLTLELAVFGEMEIGEIALQLKQTAAGVRQNLSRARAQLRVWYAS